MHRKRILSFFAAALSGTLACLPIADAQGWWWGSPVDPSFDRNAILEVTGTASQVAIKSSAGPSTLHLRTADESLTVVLGPSWYLSQVGADIRNGDTLSVEGAKMKDRQGQVYLVASRLTNHRTNRVIELRDKAGRPQWKQGRPLKGRG